jgi:cation transport ATPase
MPDEPLAICRHRSGGIGGVLAGMLPPGQVDAVRQLQGGGRVVVIVSDGINDTAIEASDLTLDVNMSAVGARSIWRTAEA